MQNGHRSDSGRLFVLYFFLFIQTNTSIETVCVFVASTVHSLNVLFPRAHGK